MPEGMSKPDNNTQDYCVLLLKSKAFDGMYLNERIVDEPGKEIAARHPANKKSLFRTDVVSIGSDESGETEYYRVILPSVPTIISEDQAKLIKQSWLASELVAGIVEKIISGLSQEEKAKNIGLCFAREIPSSSMTHPRFEALKAVKLFSDKTQFNLWQQLPVPSPSTLSSKKG